MNTLPFDTAHGVATVATPTQVLQEQHVTRLQYCLIDQRTFLDRR
jgi:hypothetical protein